MKLLFKTLFLCTFIFASVATSSQSATNIVELTPTNMVMVRGEITGDSIAKTQQSLSRLLAKRGKAAYPIYIVFYSGGGSVDAGLMLYELTKPYTQIHTIVVRGYSMAAVLPQLIQGKRYIVETGEMMFHRISFASGRPKNPDQAQSEVNSVKALEAFIEKKISIRTGIPLEELRRKANEDWWISASEAVERHIVDAEITIKCSKELLQQKEKQLIEILPFLPPVEVETSNCPLML